MAIYKHRRSFDSDPKKPLAREIEIGEIVINVSNKTLWTKNDQGNVVSLTRTNDEIRAIVEADSDGAISGDDIIDFRIDEAVDTRPLYFIRRNGDSELSGITLLGTTAIPSLDTDYINKKYLDSEISKLDTKIENIDITGDIVNNRQLIFQANGIDRKLIKFRESDESVQTIRTAFFNNETDKKFIIRIASFDPDFSISYDPTLFSGFINWDIVFDSFTVIVENPEDVTGQYISDVESISDTTGNVETNLNNYSIQNKSQTPDDGITWTQEFQTKNEDSTFSAIIGPDSTSLTGGTAKFTINFEQTIGTATSNYTDDDLDFEVKWRTPNTTLTFPDQTLNTKTFLEVYEDVSFEVDTTNITDENNVSYNFSTQTNGSVGDDTVADDRSYNGTFTFDSDKKIWWDSIGDNDFSLTVTSTLSRPEGVTGSSYDIDDTDPKTFDPDASVVFNFPVYYLVAKRTEGFVPSSSDFITGNEFRDSDDLQNNILVGPVQHVSNLTTWENLFLNEFRSNITEPARFWIAVPNNNSSQQNNQPDEFIAGTEGSAFEAIDQDDESVFTQEDITLEPDTDPINGYTGSAYRLYGFNYAPGNDIAIRAT